ncbi:MAG: ribosomal protein S18-alanine N-acetyltransferase [Actinomycetota bacterium]|nr:ribosomal protein S18-alanine N-acetyltransferase [Actinomycetota bacterium]
MTRVRRATDVDVDAVAALEVEVFGADAWSAASVAGELTGPGRQALVAVDDSGAVCGYVVVLLVGDVADLQRVAVAPALRRRGVASALLAGCHVGAARMLLEVRADNAGALAFYDRHGFAEIARRRRYYADGADAVVMKREVRAAAGR